MSQQWILKILTFQSLLYYVLDQKMMKEGMNLNLNLNSDGELNSFSFSGESHKVSSSYIARF